ncbi:hypothetical protein BD309DRAFT_481992 [Dichomitus squalens]|uniref:Uncharacterized protein n=1 Tax=Dichomitus squalens TaxID=114155 RepID=A0A4Q9NEY7_9APHY|nr:hypothetical protein BD309DRAFT_481992 [Dichomitus squalens]TBU57316.1 hypothetical protein BD310DRAFT_554576 [Dichomitus squalens]
MDASRPYHLQFLSAYLTTGLEWTQAELKLKMLLLCQPDGWAIQITSHSLEDQPIGGLRIVISLPEGVRFGYDDASWLDLKEAIRAFMLSPPLMYGTQVAWISGQATEHAGRAGFVGSLLSLPNVRELYLCDSGWTAREGLTESLGSALPNCTPPHIPLPQLDTLYLTIYDQSGLDKVSAVLRSRREARCGIRRLLVEFDLDYVPDFGSAEDPIQTMRGALEPYVEELRFLTSERQCHKKHSLSRALSGAVCVEPDYHLRLLWAPWTEDGHASFGVQWG